MKPLSLILLLAAGAWLGSVAWRAQDPDYSPEVIAVPHALTGTTPEGYRDVLVAIDGMCGPCCERTLFDKARDVEGVADVAVSFDDEHVLVRLEDGADPEALVSALESEQHSASLSTH